GRRGRRGGGRVRRAGQRARGGGRRGAGRRPGRRRRRRRGGARLRRAGGRGRGDGGRGGRSAPDNRCMGALAASLACVGCARVAVVAGRVGGRAGDHAVAVVVDAGAHLGCTRMHGRAVVIAILGRSVAVAVGVVLEHDVGPVVRGLVGLRREDPAVAIVKDTVRLGRGVDREVNRRVVEAGGGERVRGPGVVAGRRVIRRHVGGAGIDRDRVVEGGRLPPL